MDSVWPVGQALSYAPLLALRSRLDGSLSDDDSKRLAGAASVGCLAMASMAIHSPPVFEPPLAYTSLLSGGIWWMNESRPRDDWRP